MNKRDDQPVSFSPEPSVHDRLDSWKEIAAYLKRDTRTVQRWETEEGLPIRRLHHKRQNTIYAYKSELDAWMEQRGSGNGRRAVTSWPYRAGWVAVASVVVVASLVAWQKRNAPVSATPAPLKIVVLPFQNLSGDAQQEYFSDGLTEEMITELGRINPSRLMVIARTSAMTYKHTQKSARQITQELGVDYLLEGSVRREGERVRITLQLINGQDASDLWSESFDTQMAGILDTQRQVAAEVTRKIQVSLASFELPAKRAGEVNPKAYESLLIGRHHFNRWSADGFLKASRSFEQAVRTQPDYAFAQAQLSMSYSMLAFYGVVPPAQAADRARAAANSALELDSDLGEAYEALGLINIVFDHDWLMGGQALQRAAEDLPHSSDASAFFGYYLAAVGRHEESIAVMRRAETFDPLSTLAMTNLADAYRYARQYDEALKELDRAQQLEPNFPRTQLLKEAVFEAKEMYREAATAHQRYLALVSSQSTQDGRFQPEPPWHNLTRDTYWRWKLGQLQDEGREPHRRSRRAREIGRAQAYAALGDSERACFWLEKALQDGTPPLFIRVNPSWDPLRHAPRFQALLRRMNFSV